MISSGRHRAGGKSPAFGERRAGGAYEILGPRDSACTALSPDGTLKLSVIFGRESPLHPGPG
jgi:hypothetical protein